jgi:hypothetical protein
MGSEHEDVGVVRVAGDSVVVTGADGFYIMPTDLSSGPSLSRGWPKRVGALDVTDVGLGGEQATLWAVSGTTMHREHFGLLYGVPDRLRAPLRWRPGCRSDLGGIGGLTVTQTDLWFICEDRLLRLDPQTFRDRSLPIYGRPFLFDFAVALPYVWVLSGNKRRTVLKYRVLA